MKDSCPQSSGKTWPLKKGFWEDGERKQISASYLTSEVLCWSADTEPVQIGVELRVAGTTRYNSINVIE